MSAARFVCFHETGSHLVQRVQEDGPMLVDVQDADVGLQFGDEHRLYSDRTKRFVVSESDC